LTEYWRVTDTDGKTDIVFGASPKISDKSYTSIKEIQLYRRTEETGTYHIANMESQRRHDSSLQDNDRQRQNRQRAALSTGRQQLWTTKP